jgi:hypothetical protein
MPRRSMPLHSSTGRMDSPMAAISSSSAATMLVSIPKR